MIDDRMLTSFNTGGLESVSNVANSLPSTNILDSIGKGVNNIGSYIGSGLESIDKYATKYGKGIDLLTKGLDIGLAGLKYKDTRDYNKDVLAMMKDEQARSQTMEDQAIASSQSGFANSGLMSPHKRKLTSLADV